MQIIRKQMTASEWVWTKIGFGITAISAGGIWGLIFYPFISNFIHDVSLRWFLLVFMVSFFIITMLNEKLIGKAGLGAIYALVGMLYGFLSTGGFAPSDSSWTEYGKELAVCFIIGMISAFIVVSF